MDSKQLFDIQLQRNRQTQHNWERGREHREAIHDHIVRHGNASLLRSYGAGNCNDLDLKKLSKTFTAIELIDIDTEAMASAVGRQNANVADGIRILGDIDLSLSDHVPSQSADVTVSSCLFTPLLEQFLENNVTSSDLISEFRAQHLNMLIRGTKAQGHVYFITDIVSDLTAPRLARLPNDQLNGFLSRLIENRNFFSGTNPFAIQKQLDDDPRVHTSNLLDAWKWKLGPRTFAVYGIHAQLKGS